MCAHLKAMGRKILGVVYDEFVVIDPKDPTPRAKELLQLNDQALVGFYEVGDPKVFESIKDLEMAHKVWIRLASTTKDVKLHL